MCIYQTFILHRTYLYTYNHNRHLAFQKPVFTICLLLCNTPQPRLNSFITNLLKGKVNSLGKLILIILLTLDQNMSVLFKNFSDVCSPAKGKRCLQKKTSNKTFIVVLSFLTRCERPECRKVFFVMQEYKFPSMAHHSYMTIVSMREMSDREKTVRVM